MSDMNLNPINSQSAKHAATQNIKQVNTEGNTAEVPQATCDAEGNKVAFGAAVDGRSQIKADNIANDLKFLAKNPNLVDASIEYGDNAYDYLNSIGETEAYEMACMLSQAFAQELQ